ncbi:type I restriction endonuclease subunit R [Mucilaginibacter sp. HMF5004]|uniref:type I restriction endonuclease subunit R n=1 Tax=Mucilaginibacter rivuli TaxID=2857527 RepID=UPI001C5D3E4A|nr:type I restriction endonuclease subunit R [Mucilaginibacter rivuli]MBW4888107.1 type I restriction endonuclease subunit R [Mucilaginibacter rivuli]
MTTQPEQVLEDNLVIQLKGLGYAYVVLKDEQALLANLKSQLEKHNEVTITDTEFEKTLNHLNKGNLFERAKTLRDKVQYTKDNGDSAYIEFINQEHWCQNQFQVTQQVTMQGAYKNRYDVTILVNGLPLVQIELKRRGLELKEAFNQTNRYHRHSYGASHGLFLYIQLFVISNGVNTKYYANNPHQSFKQTFYWSDRENKVITQLEQFTKIFLEPCHVSKMITRYTVLNEAQKMLMILRPYQYYASEAIIERVKTTAKNGYIWHTTGSGKTLTSFKASQLLVKQPQVYKVVFVVDRKDLDYQTTKEFNSFSKGSIDGTDNTQALVKQLGDDTKLIVTTIQKLNTAISKPGYLSRMEKLKDKRIVFIFDECHRSQFGETHNRIKAFFNNHQLFGFTGTPIFADNAIKNELGKRTTKELFDDCLHKYVITDAIKDENVLKFSVEYVGRYKQKEDSNNNIDIKVEDIDTKELLESPDRLNKITDYILQNHDKKTHGRTFTGMFCVSSVDTLIKYYELFKAKKLAGEHRLRIATIFSYGANEDDKDANGFIPDPELEIDDNAPINKHTREKLDEFITDYNAMYGTKFSTKDSQSFYNYYNDIAKKVKNKEVDILLVVDMFLTGFDSKPLNTLYVDKNLKYHGLIQAYSRTNRILNEQKSQGNIVVFRNLKAATDEAITLFSNKDAIDVIIMQPIEDYVAQFNKGVEELYAITPTVDSVNYLEHEEDELSFVKAFRELLRIKNILTTFADFSFDSLGMTEQTFNDYRSKYLDLYDKVKTDNSVEKVSILNDVDFELELIHRDEINVLYILKLLAKLKYGTTEEQAQQRKAILDLLTGEIQLRSKKELIEKFIIENLPLIEDVDEIPAAFDAFVNDEKRKALVDLCKQEGLVPEKLNDIIGNYLFTERKPLRDDVFDILIEKPKLLERKPVVERVIDKVLKFIDTYINGMPESETIV